MGDGWGDTGVMAGETRGGHVAPVVVVVEAVVLLGSSPQVGRVP